MIFNNTSKIKYFVNFKRDVGNYFISVYFEIGQLLLEVREV